MARRLAFLLLTVAVAALGVIVLEPGDVEAGAYPVPQGSYQGCDGGRPGSVCGTFPGRDGSLQIAACPNGQGPVMSGGIWTCAASSASSTCHFDGGTGLVALGQDGGSICVPVPLPPYVISTVDASSGSVICSTSGGNAHWCPNVTTTGCDAGEVVGNIEAGIPHCIASSAPTYPIAETLGGTGANLGAGACPAGSVVQGTSVSAMTCNAFSGGVTVDSTGTTTVTGGSSATSAWAMSKGGLGQALTCASGNLLLATSTTLAQCEAMSGDCTISATGVVTCSGLQNQEIVAGASTGTLTCAAGATACGEAQASESATQTPHAMAFSGQASTHATTADGKIYTFDLGSVTGAGTQGYAVFNAGGAQNVLIGPYPSAPAYGAIWFGAGARSASNYAFIGDGATFTQLNSPGTTYVSEAGTVIGTMNTSGWSLGGILTVGPTSAGAVGGANIAVALQVSSTLSSGSASGGSIVESYNGSLWAFGEQATSLPITPTLLAPGYSGTLNTLTSSSWVAAQNPTRANERFVRSITGGGSNTTTTMPMTALTDSRSATETAYITCECMVASTGNVLGDVASARAVANYTYSHAGTLTTSGTPLLTDSIVSSAGETLTVAWGVSSAQPTLTVTAASSNMVGSWACTVNTDERLN